MKRLLPLLLLVCLVSVAHAQVLRPFLVDKTTTGLMPSDQHIKKFVLAHFSNIAFESARPTIPALATVKKLHNSNAIIELPTADGSYQKFFIVTNEILSTESALLHPEIKTYSLLSIDGNIQGRLTYSPMGVKALLLTGEGREYITPLSNANNQDHVVYSVKDYELPPGAKISCNTDERGEKEDIHDVTAKGTNVVLGDCQLRTYRLAVASTGEYTTQSGSQANAIANITSMVNDINLIYERDATIHFTLVINNSIVFTNGATDPYPTVSFPTAAGTLDTNKSVLNTNIGSANYDVGFVVSYEWNGGLAQLGATCGTGKGRGAGGTNFQTTGSVFENLIAHEIGHMFNATHTMSTGTNSPTCDANVTLSTAYEPGGGSTIMAYAGSVCSGLSYQNNTDAYFHYNSVALINNYAINNATCATVTSSGNTAPTLTVAASSYNIPVSTPFELRATGYDANGNSTTYTFEQYDAAGTYMLSTPASTNTTGPMFRSRPPTTTNYRYLPQLSDILAGNNTGNTYEVIPSVTRTLNWRFLARDNSSGHGCIAGEAMTVNTTSTSGPFAITSQNTTSSFTYNGTNTMTITWNVASTTSSPVSAANVNIYLSTDQGQTFPYPLALNTANDGTETILVPNVNTAIGRIKVQGASNIFFDINNADITISSPSCAANGTTFSPSNDLTAQAGNSALNMGLSPNYGTAVTISGTLASTDPSSNLAVNNPGPGTCISAGNTYTYDQFIFTPSVSGSYTFTASGSTSTSIVFNIYQGSYNPSSPCTNLLNSNGSYNGSSVTISSNFSQTLTAGLTYVVTVGTFAAGSPSLPSSYTINVTPPAGGGIFTGPADPGASYSYTYVIVNNSTGNIVAFNSTSNMTNSTTYPAGSYTVYGLSYSSSISQATLNTYVGGSYTTFQAALLNGTLCGNTSSNSRSVTITSNPLPITGIQLSASPIGNAIVLNWESAGSEKYINYELDRSADGAQFEPIYGQQAATASHDYSYTDKQAVIGKNYYRVRGTNVAGAFQYSNVVVATIVDHDNDIVAFPNPTSGVTTVRLPEAWQGADLQLMDISGRVLQSTKLVAQEIQVQLGSYAPGVYYLRLAGKDGKRSNIRLVRY